jgi:hypothetical protein
MLRKVPGKMVAATTSVKQLKMKALEVNLTTSKTVGRVNKLSTITSTLPQRQEQA